MKFFEGRGLFRVTVPITLIGPRGTFCKPCVLRHGATVTLGIEVPMAFERLPGILDEAPFASPSSEGFAQEIPDTGDAVKACIEALPALHWAFRTDSVPRFERVCNHCARVSGIAA